MIDIKIVRKLYPNPCTAYDYGSNYCVGGALCKYLSKIPIYNTSIINAGFDGYATDRCMPIPSVLRKILNTVNPSVTTEDCLEITKANDNGDFDRAWDMLDKVINKK